MFPPSSNLYASGKLQQRIFDEFNGLTWQPHHMNVQHGKLWDCLTVDAGAMIPSRFNFFTDIAGKTITETNLVRARCLPPPDVFAVKRVIFTFSRMATDRDVFSIAEEYTLLIHWPVELQRAVRRKSITPERGNVSESSGVRLFCFQAVQGCFADRHCCHGGDEFAGRSELFLVALKRHQHALLAAHNGNDPSEIGHPLHHAPRRCDIGGERREPFQIPMRGGAPSAMGASVMQPLVDLPPHDLRSDSLVNCRHKS